MRRVRRPALRYHGGKWKIAPWIIGFFPPHTCYVEPYGGAAGVLLRKPPSFIEVYNDLSRDVVNFFKVLRERPAELISAVELTPYSREEYRRSHKRADDELEAARRFYVRSWQGRGRAGVQDPGGWRYMKRDSRSQTPVDDWNNCQLWPIVERMKQVQLECCPALGLIERYDEPGTLFYCDPPYLQETRSNRWGTGAYEHEMTEEDHCTLAETLQGIEGMAIVSGYESGLYDELYAGWRRAEHRSQTDNGGSRVECIWISPQADARRLPLFSEIRF